MVLFYYIAPKKCIAEAKLFSNYFNPRFREGSDEREKEIICLRYGLYRNGEVTQRQIAEQLGISRSYVSRIEKKALKKLKKEFDNRNIHFHG